jgi:uncharacterized protein (TIGR02466 family)
MPTVNRLFASPVYQAALGGPRRRAFNAELKAACLAIAADDRAGQVWSKANAYKGYTSYASLNDLAWRDPVVAELCVRLQQHAEAYARLLEFDLGDRALELDSLWINILEPGGVHAAHIHPNAAISGTYYVALPDGASGLTFEDPRHALMMSAPPKKTRAARANRTRVTFNPKPGDVVLWESFLRHEVERSDARSPRISISFNYAWR